MICVDYNYYIKTYGGVEMPPSKFTALELRATKHINKITSNRIDFENIDSLGEEIEENIKLAVCSVIELLDKYSKNIISSEKTGDNSVTYVVSSSSKEKEIYKEVRMYLADTGLLFRGIN